MLGGTMGNNFRDAPAAEFVWTSDASTEKNSGLESDTAVDWTYDSVQSHAFIPIDHFMI